MNKKDEINDKPEEKKSVLKLNGKQKMYAAAAFFICSIGFLASSPDIRRQFSAVDIVTAKNKQTLNHQVLSALATNDISALGVLHAHQAIEIKGSLLSELTMNGLLPSNDDEAINSLVYSLIRSGDTAIESLDNINAAIYLNKAAPHSVAIVMQGEFNAAEVRQHIKDNYTLLGDGDATVIGFSLIDPKTCEMSQTYKIRISKRQLVIASEEVFKTTLTRLDEKSPSQIDLTEWNKFSENHLISSMLIVPQKTAPFRLNTIANTRMQELVEKSQNIDSIFVAATVTALPVALKLTMQINEKSGASVEAIFGDIQSVLDNPDKGWTQHYRSLKKIFNDTKIVINDNQLMMYVTLNSASIVALQSLPMDMVTEMTGGGYRFDLFNLVDEEGLVIDELDETNVTYSDLLSIEALTEYDPEAQFAGPVDTVTGPFGISLESISNDDKKTIIVNARNLVLPNSTGHKVAQLYLLKALDESGKNLAQAKQCGILKNNSKNYLIDDSSVASAETEIQIDENVDMRSIKSIEGIVKLSIPSKVKTVALKLQPGARYEHEDAWLEVMDTTSNAFTLRQTGNTQRILEVHGLNAAGNRLKQRSHVSKKYALGYGQSSKYVFHGEIDSIELVIADEIMNHDYPYTLTRIEPLLQKQHISRNNSKYYNIAIETFKEKYTKAPRLPADSQESLGSALAGPFNVSIRQLPSLSSLEATFDIYTGKAYNLENNLSAVTLRIDEMSGVNGASYLPGKKDSWSEHAFLAQRSELLHDDVTIPTSLKVKGYEIVNLTGTLTVNMATSYKIHTWDSPKIGDSYQVDDSTRLLVTKISRGGMTLAAEGDVNRIVTIKPLTEKDAEIWTTSVDIQSSPGWELDLQYHGDPKKLAILMAENVGTEEYPFSIRLH